MAVRVVSFLVTLVVGAFADTLAAACGGWEAGAGSGVATRLAVERDERVWRRGFGVALGARGAAGAVVALAWELGLVLWLVCGQRSWSWLCAPALLPAEPLRVVTSG